MIINTHDNRVHLTLETKLEVLDCFLCVDGEDYKLGGDYCGATYLGYNINDDQFDKTTVGFIDQSLKNFWDNLLIAVSDERKKYPIVWSEKERELTVLKFEDLESDRDDNDLYYVAFKKLYEVYGSTEAIANNTIITEDFNDGNPYCTITDINTNKSFKLYMVIDWQIWFFIIPDILNYNKINGFEDIKEFIKGYDNDY